MNEHVRFPIEGMTCTSCVSRITRAVRRLDGVEAVKVNLGSDSAEVAFDPSRTSLPAIADVVRRVGYEAHLDRAEPFIPMPRRGLMTFVATLNSARRPPRIRRGD